MNARNLLIRFISFVVFFNLVFPKGGVKISGIPITFGYVLFIVSTLLILVFYRMPSYYSKYNQEAVITYIATLPFTLVIFSYAFFVGVSNNGFFMSMVLSFTIFPFLFFIVIPADVSSKIPIEKIIVLAVRVIVVYGIVLFFYKMITGDFIEIPYLTINEADMGMMEEKHINRAGVFKLISTYNNGNIYGVCMLMLCPIYSIWEKRNSFKCLFVFSLLLTLSRGAWLVYILWIIFYNFKDAKVKKILLSLAGVVAFFTFAYGIVTSIGYSSDFIFDSSGGGRFENLKPYIPTFALFSNTPFDYVSEITYLSIIYAYGFVGLLLFSVMIILPFFRLFFVKNLNQEQKSCTYGACIYSLSCCVDGATIYIPVMFVYWLVVWISFKKRGCVNADR